jgi:hypothetical protein
MEEGNREREREREKKEELREKMRESETDRNYDNQTSCKWKRESTKRHDNRRKGNERQL